MKSLLIIDFDDCLCQTEEACFRLENAVANELGFPSMTREIHRANWGKPIEHAIVERLPGIDLTCFMAEFKEQLPTFIEKGDFDRISDVNLQTLKNLQSSGMTLVVLTSRTHVEVQHLLPETSELFGIIDRWYYKEITLADCGEVKPHPMVIKNIMQNYGLPSENVSSVGDTPSDGLCANGAGVSFIASLESGLRTQEDFKNIQVDHFIYSFGEIEQILLEK